MSGFSSGLVLPNVGTTGAPTTGGHGKNELWVDSTGVLWICTVAGTPGTWVQCSAAGGGVATFNTRTGAVVLSAADVTTALPNASAGGGAGTTTSAAFATLSGTPVSVALTTNTKVKVTVTGTMSNPSVGTDNLGFAISGATTLAASQANALVVAEFTAAFIQQASAVFILTVTAGANTFTLQSSTNTGTLTVANGSILVECLN